MEESLVRVQRHHQQLDHLHRHRRDHGEQQLVPLRPDPRRPGEDVVKGQIVALIE